MKQLLHYSWIVIVLLASSSLQAQSPAKSLKIRRAIMVTDTIIDEQAKIAVSTDDAEQENDEIDALYDDDLDAGWEGAPEDRNVLTTGLRFRNLAIPKAARIDSAFIIVYSHEGKSKDDVARLTITADASDNAPTFTEDSLITARTRTAAKIRWEVKEVWGLWTPHRTPDLKAIIQEVVNRQGWNAGNAMAFIVQGEDQGPSEVENAREWESFENIADPGDGGDGQNHPERRPELLVYYSISGAKVETTIMITDTIVDEEAKLAVSSDDAEQENDEIDALFDDDLDAGWEGAPEDRNILTTGMRFRNILIPQGARIDSAYIVVYSHEGKSAEDVARLTITGDANDNAPTFTEDSLITARSRTSAKTLWEVKEQWGLWTPHQTPSLKAIVQELVNRPGWEAGNAMAFIFQGEDQGPSEVENAREWESYENIADPGDGGDGQNHPERVPRLVVYYSSADQSTSTRTAFDASVKALKVFPNPSKAGEITLEFDATGASTIRLYSAKGQLIKTQRNDYGKQIRFQTGNLSTGVYYIQANQGQDSYVQKLVIE